MTVEAALAKTMVGLARSESPDTLRAYLLADTLGELA